MLRITIHWSRVPMKPELTNTANFSHRKLFTVCSRPKFWSRVDASGSALLHTFCYSEIRLSLLLLVPQTTILSYRLSTAIRSPTKPPGPVSSPNPEP